MTTGMGNTINGFGMAGMWASVILWAAVLALLLAWALAGTRRREEQPIPVRIITTEDVLRERLARGEISAREFESELLVLRDS